MNAQIDYSEVAQAPEELTVRKELLRRARELIPLFRKNAAKAEMDRRVSDENINALIDAGLFHFMLPKRYGGYSAGIRTHLEVISTIAEGCSATAWVTNLMTMNSWIISLMSEQAQDDVFKVDPRAITAGVFQGANVKVVRCEGGVKISGKWFWASGSLHASWMTLGIVESPGADGRPVPYTALVPMSDLRIEDTWFTVGMRGSGSNCVVAEDVFVPEYRLMPSGPASEGQFPTPYKEGTQRPFAAALTLILVGPQLGLAREALRLVIDAAPKRAITYTTFTKQSDSAGFQIQVAEAALKIDSAHLHAWYGADTIDSAARTKTPLSLAEKGRIRGSTAYIAQQVIEAIQILINAHGAGTFAEANPLQRVWRDSNTAARHAFVVPFPNYQSYGQTLLAVEPNIALML